jgi:hypothetical protein
VDQETEDHPDVPLVEDAEGFRIALGARQQLGVRETVEATHHKHLSAPSKL